MAHHHIPHAPIYEGDKDPKHHCFISETIWEEANMIDEAQKKSQFVGALIKTVLTWYMNFEKNNKRCKREIQQNFLISFKTQDVKHLAFEKIKEIKKTLGDWFVNMTRE